MKATFDISEKRLEALKELGFKPIEDNKWTPAGDNFVVYGNGGVVDDETIKTDNIYKKRGMTRNTLEQAKVLSEKLKTVALIDAFKCEFGTDGDFYVREAEGTWGEVEVVNTYYPEVITMNEECAKLLAEKLNDGTVVL